MNIRQQVILTINGDEARYIVSGLANGEQHSESLADLTSTLTEGLAQFAPLVASGLADVEIEIGLDASLLAEVMQIFATRSANLDRAEGQDPEIGRRIASTLLDAFCKAERFDGEVTRNEADALARVFEMAQEERLNDVLNKLFA
jgi:hypothetical protein